MKITRQGKMFVAKRDKNDVDSPDGVGMNSRIKVGNSLGRINIKTGTFVGNTVCLVELTSHRDTFHEELINKVIDRIKTDIAEEDLTAIDELLSFLPTERLEGFLPEQL